MMNVPEIGNSRRLTRLPQNMMLKSYDSKTNYEYHRFKPELKFNKMIQRFQIP